MTRPGDVSGQVFTMEGIIAALILVLAMVFITNSINLVSPSTEKAIDMKLTIKAQDTLAALNMVDQPSNFSSTLKRGLAAWTGQEGNKDAAVSPAEASIQALDQQIQSLLPPNVFYNLEVVYWDDTAGALETKTLIYHGDAQNLAYNAVSGYKNIVINSDDTRSLSDSYWKDMAKPKAFEVVLIMWSI